MEIDEIGYTCVGFVRVDIYLTNRISKRIHVFSYGLKTRIRAEGESILETDIFMLSGLHEEGERLYDAKSKTIEELRFVRDDRFKYYL